MVYLGRVFTGQSKMASLSPQKRAKKKSSRKRGEADADASHERGWPQKKNRARAGRTSRKENLELLGEGLTERVEKRDGLWERGEINVTGASKPKQGAHTLK